MHGFCRDDRRQSCVVRSTNIFFNLCTSEATRIYSCCTHSSSSATGWCEKERIRKPKF